MPSTCVATVVPIVGCVCLDGTVRGGTWPLCPQLLQQSSYFCLMGEESEALKVTWERQDVQQGSHRDRVCTSDS